MDVNYNFEVMLPELAEIYALTRNRTVVGMARKFADWFGHNVVREPDGSGSLTYVATSSRTHVSYYDDVDPGSRPDQPRLAVRAGGPGPGRVLHQPRGPRRDAPAVGEDAGPGDRTGQTGHFTAHPRARLLR